MPKQIHFSQLEQILKTLGFEEKWVDGKYVIFNNPEADAIIALSSYQKDKVLDPAYQQMVEKVLEETGIMSRDDFEDLLYLKYREIGQNQPDD
jgi:hypothetical protein